MAYTALTVTSVPSSYANTTAVITWNTASILVPDVDPDVSVDGDNFALTGKELLLVRNTVGDASAKTVTVDSVACQHGRTGDIDAQSIPDTKVYVMPMFKSDGWLQTDRSVHVAAEDDNIKLAVLRLPD